jgi:hypothetical protein
MLKSRLLLTAMIVALLPIAASAQTSNASRCDQLAAFYDRSAKPIPIDQGWSPAGRAERTLGYEDCRKGKVDAGIRLLEEAIRKVGYQVPAA